MIKLIRLGGPSDLSHRHLVYPQAERAGHIPLVILHEMSDPKLTPLWPFFLAKCIGDVQQGSTAHQRRPSWPPGMPERSFINHWKEKRVEL